MSAQSLDQNLPIFEKDNVVIRPSKALAPGVMFAVTFNGEAQTKEFDLYFQVTPGSGGLGFTDEALLAVLRHRMQLKHAATGNDQWRHAAEYLGDVEETIAAAKRRDVS
jgi:hypothetical protein